MLVGAALFVAGFVAVATGTVGIVLGNFTTTADDAAAAVGIPKMILNDDYYLWFG